MDVSDQTYKSFISIIDEKMNLFESKILEIIEKLKKNFEEKIAKIEQDLGNEKKIFQNPISEHSTDYSFDLVNFPQKIEAPENKNKFLLNFEISIINKGQRIIPMNSNLIFIEETNQLNFEKITVGKNLEPNEERYFTLKIKIPQKNYLGQYQVIARLTEENRTLLEKKFYIKIVDKINEQIIKKVIRELNEEYGILSVYKEDYVRQMIILSNGDKLKALSCILNS